MPRHPQLRRVVRACATLAVVLLSPTPATGLHALPSAQELIARSIAYHDPEGYWNDGVFRLRLQSTRPGAGPAHTTIVIDNAGGRFLYERDLAGHRIEAAVTGEECWTRLDGSAQPTPEQVRRFGLSCAQMRRTRDYHLYLYGLPMKLRDAGTRIDPTVRTARVGGRDLWQVRVTYDPEVGGDSWTFFFDPASAALVGGRFSRGRAEGDGESIVFAGLVQGGGLRLPAVRTWYRTGDDALLGTDTILSIERLSRSR